VKSLDDAKKHVNKYEEDELCSGSIACQRKICYKTRIIKTTSYHSRNSCVYNRTTNN